MEKKDAKELLQKYIAGNCSEEEAAMLESWYLDWQDGEFDLSEKDLKSIKDQTLAKLEQSQEAHVVFFRWRRHVAAAVVLTVLTAGLFFYYTNRIARPTDGKYAGQLNKVDASPGGNKASLTLADGTIVRLDDVGKGKIVELAGITIQKTADGEVVYETAPSNVHNKIKGTVSYNQLTTPRGGQYKIILPDGTSVWLNAASSLKYPEQFADNTRRVELVGEGYFQVKSLRSTAGERIPFFVSTKRQTVEVVGTQFNINSYDDEHTELTTLVEGSVKISQISQKGQTFKAMLKPGQQAALNEETFNIRTIDTDEAISWKNGYFSFNAADLSTVLRQLSRWYDIDVSFAGELPSETFTGKFYRNMSLSQVLEILSYSEIKFSIQGKKLIITP